MRIVAGSHKNCKILSPKGMQTRPTSERLRETLFNICQNYIEGAHFLDLFAGSGAMGLEALSRGAAAVTFIDSHSESTKIIRQNLQAMNFQQSARVIEGDVFVQLKRLHTHEKPFDIIYADPPYSTYKEGEPYSLRVLKALDRCNILAPGGYLFVEEASTEKILEEENFENLCLKSIRKAGRSQLLQYQQKLYLQSTRHDG